MEHRIDSPSRHRVQWKDGAVVLVIDEHSRIVGESTADPISLMRIEIDISDGVVLTKTICLPQVFNCDRHICIDAEPMPVLSAGVVVAASEVDDQLMLQCEIRTHHRTQRCPAHGAQDQPVGYPPWHL